MPLAAVLLVACATAELPPDSLRLHKSRIEAAEGLRAADYAPYIRQHGGKGFSLTRLSLRREAVAFDTLLAETTCRNINSVLRGNGYLRATTDYRLEPRRHNAVDVIYQLHPDSLFHITSLTYDIHDTTIARLLTLPAAPPPLLHEGMPLRVNTLNNERKRITAYLNDRGYFRFNKEYISFVADTLNSSNTAALTLTLHQHYASSNDSLSPHQAYTVSRILYNGDTLAPAQRIAGLPLRSKTLAANTAITAGQPFSATDLQTTYNRFSRLPIIRYTNIKFTPIASDSLLCNINLGTTKPNSLSLQPEGTNTSGDLGAALSLTYQNRNLFHGGETFSLKLRGAFEAITGLEGYQNHDYEEYNIETALTLARYELTASYNMQRRPEFHRNLFAAGWRHRWASPSGRNAYRIDLLDLNYIYMPWVSATFKSEYLDNTDSRNSILKYNYENLLIMKLGFSVSTTTTHGAYKLSIESAGNLLYAASNTLHTTPNADGQYTVCGTAYAQYVKGDIDCTRLLTLDRRTDLALHAAIGIAYPYGNSSILPFEKRYFSGGANSVRGWSVRSLGPGRTKPTNGSIDYINQTGDLKLDLSLELRHRLMWKLSLAGFVDAGNVWTLRYYDEQADGQFRFNTFLEEIAVAYGAGVRLTLDYFTLRFDLGMKAINPAYTDSRRHYPLLHPILSRDLAFHFAVGLPF